MRVRVTEDYPHKAGVKGTVIGVTARWLKVNLDDDPEGINPYLLCLNEVREVVE